MSEKPIRRWAVTRRVHEHYEAYGRTKAEALSWAGKYGDPSSSDIKGETATPLEAVTGELLKDIEKTLKADSL